MIRLAVVLLVDRRGWVLLQERDEHAPIDPERWGLLGGHVEDGEEPEAAAYRELEEETGIRLAPGDLTLWRDEVQRWSVGAGPRRYTIWVAGTRAVDADVVLGEGRQIVFVDPAAVAGLELGSSAAHYLPAFLGSPEHRVLQDVAGRAGDPPGLDDARP